MGTVTVLSVEDITTPDRAAVLTHIRLAFAQLGAGRAVQPAQTLTVNPDGGDVIVYSALLADSQLFAVKVSPYLPQPSGAAVVTAWTMLISLATGDPVLLVDSKMLTAQRTAATSALAVDLLAPPHAQVLAIIGGGQVAQEHAAYARLVRPFADIRVFSPSGLGSERLARFGTAVTETTTAAAAIEGAQVVMLCTSAAEPVIDIRTLAPNTVVTSVSTNAFRAHEIDPSALATLDVYCDHKPSAALAAGEMLLAEENGIWHSKSILADLAELAAAQRKPQPSNRVRFFRSIGLGIEDAAIAGALLTERPTA